MDRRNEDTALLALRGGLRGRFRRSFDSMENAFEVLQDRLQHAVNPAERAELMPLLEELQTQLICLRRLGDQASDAATAALLHGTCVPQPIDLLGQLREFCSILQEEAAQYALPFTVTLQADGLDVLPTTGDVSLLNGLLTNLVSNTLAADRAAHIMLLCTPGRLCYRDNGPGLPPDAAGRIQSTEAALGPYALHDFFLYHVMKSGFARAKIEALAAIAFPEVDKALLSKTAATFFRRFYAQQFKRSSLPDGPQIGYVALSPRGDLRLPSDLGPIES